MRKQTRRTSGSPSGPDRVKRARISEPRDQGPCDAPVRAGNEDQGALVSAPAPHTNRVVGTKRKLECDARHEDMHSPHSELKSQFLGWTFLSSILMVRPCHGSPCVWGGGWGVAFRWHPG
jgi:hypothetical protein